MLTTIDGAMPPHRAGGAITLISVVVMSTLTLALAGALFVLLLAGHQAIGQRLEREIAFRGAETALFDGERDLSRATAASGTGAASTASTGRFASWPAPGHCGTQAQRGLCSPAAGQPPPWRAWMDGVLFANDIGIPIGSVTGATLPPIPPEMAGTTIVPRYLIERLPLPTVGGSSPAGSPAGAPPQRYRITALGQGRDPATRVVLQTEWIDPSPRPAAPSQPGRGRVGRVSWRELVPPF
ncbi:pilus assembly protein [Cupriavidus gilardii]|uniref:pilus assembly protein n=1 Tax=Cupriavidus gilardii TaxID=82541 RepID=UPI00157396BF|nr:pilus assembly protein [Cupriavidus gilardii]MCG5260278.1 pilus assembly protein [Cupriavidus gilardii]NSX06515.1 pilus assembly protein [Cupriavidus gilardii]